MGKISAAAAVAGVGGTGATGTYVAHSLGAFGDFGSKAPKTGTWNMGVMQGTKVDEANKCLKEIFSDWTVNTNSLGEVDPNFNWKDDSAEIKACLVYNWEKKNKNDNWKESKFHLVWALSKGDEGASVYLTATVKTSTEIVFEGFTYIFEKKEDKWQATKKLGFKDASDNKKTLSGGDWKGKFPKAGSGSGTNPFTRKTLPNDYWGFLDNSGTKVHDSGETMVSDSNLWWRWEQSEHGSYYPQNWTSNFDAWWGHFFGSDKLNMKKLMESKKIGKWT